MKIQNFLMWFKNGLKAQKLLAQGIALVFYCRTPVALYGRLAENAIIPRVLPWLGAFGPSARS